jgi:hypothetical protein
MTRRLASLASLLVLAMPLACVLTTDLDDDADTGDGTDTNDDTGEPPEIAVEDAAATMAAAHCAAYVECGCNAFGDVTWATQAQCEAAILPNLEEQVALGQAMGLTYEPSCAAAYVAYFSRGCAPASDTVIEEVAAGLACTLFSGAGPLGTPCTDPTRHLPSVDPCMPGLGSVRRPAQGGGRRVQRRRDAAAGLRAAALLRRHHDAAHVSTAPRDRREL